jgi:hypothetical protein
MIGLFGLIYLIVIGLYCQSDLMVTLGVMTLPLWFVIPVDTSKKESK